MKTREEIQKKIKEIEETLELGLAEKHYFIQLLNWVLEEKFGFPNNLSRILN